MTLWHPLFRTEAGDPQRSSYRRRVFDLSAFAGRTMRRRFVALSYGAIMYVAVDNMRVLVMGTP